jgi:hypothetical protein
VGDAHNQGTSPESVIEVISDNEDTPHTRDQKDKGPADDAPTGGAASLLVDLQERKRNNDPRGLYNIVRRELNNTVKCNTGVPGIRAGTSQAVFQRLAIGDFMCAVSGPGTLPSDKYDALMAKHEPSPTT